MATQDVFITLFHEHLLLNQLSNQNKERGVYVRDFFMQSLQRALSLTQHRQQHDLAGHCDQKQRTNRARRSVFVGAACSKLGREFHVRAFLLKFIDFKSLIFDVD